MFRRRETRRKLAVFGLILGAVFMIGVVGSIIRGDTEWWSAVLLLPTALIMFRLYLLLESSRNRS